MTRGESVCDTRFGVPWHKVWGSVTQGMGFRDRRFWKHVLHNMSKVCVTEGLKGCVTEGFENVCYTTCSKFMSRKVYTRVSQKVSKTCVTQHVESLCYGRFKRVCHRRFWKRVLHNMFKVYVTEGLPLSSLSSSDSVVIEVYVTECLQGCVTEGFASVCTGMVSNVWSDSSSSFSVTFLSFECTKIEFTSQ